MSPPGTVAAGGRASAQARSRETSSDRSCTATYDTSTQCGWCGGPMRPEHAHYRCTSCGQRDSCCDGPY